MQYFAFELRSRERFDVQSRARCPNARKRTRITKHNGGILVRREFPAENAVSFQLFDFSITKFLNTTSELVIRTKLCKLPPNKRCARMLSLHRGHSRFSLGAIVFEKIQGKCSNAEPRRVRARCSGALAAATPSTSGAPAASGGGRRPHSHCLRRVSATEAEHARCSGARRSGRPAPSRRAVPSTTILETGQHFGNSKFIKYCRLHRVLQQGFLLNALGRNLPRLLHGYSQVQLGPGRLAAGTLRGRMGDLTTPTQQEVRGHPCHACHLNNSL